MKPDEASETQQTAASIVIAYLGQRNLEPDQLIALIKDVRRALAEDLGEPAPSRSADASQANLGESPTPPPTVAETISDEFLICLEDGRPYRSLKRHLMARYGMTPEDYRSKWNLPADYPMVAPSYARERSEVAKRIGLGKSRHDPAKPPAVVKLKR